MKTKTKENLELSTSFGNKLCGDATHNMEHIYISKMTLKIINGGLIMNR